MNAHAEPGARSLDEEAARWSERLQDDDSYETQIAFAAWVGENPEHQAAFTRAERAREIVQENAHAPELASLLAETRGRIARRGSPIRLASAWRQVSVIAASIAVVALGLFAFWSPNGAVAPVNEAARAITQRAPDGGRLYETAVGQRLVVTLDDASVLTLDTASRVSVSYAQGRRDVRLYEGQAYFKVAHDPSRPFVVTAGDTRVTALGTEFDVRLAPDRLAVTLVNGRVRVDRADAESADLRPLAVLDPGEQYVAGLDTPHRVAAVDVVRTTAWRRGQLIFEGESLGEAVAEMNRYGHRRIVIGDDLASLPIAGAFDTGQSDTFVEALTAYFPIRVVSEDEAEIVLAWREPDAP